MAPEPDDRIREAMAERESLTPDPVDVYVQARARSQIYRRRRRIAQSAGGVALGAGLFLGLVQMHGFLEGAPAPGSSPSTPSTPASPTPVVSRPAPPVVIDSPTPETMIDRELDAYFGAGYDWNDAEKLARLWHLADPGDAKLEAGRRLLKGEDIPVRR